MKRVGHKFFGILQLFNSSLWITVFIVRVGCIIQAEAYPTKSNTAIIDSLQDTDRVLVANSTPATTSLNPKRKQLGGGGGKRFASSSSRSLKTDENSSLSSESGTEDVSDTCFEKKDGYYPNLSSGCSGYYFCAAGYQISYVCPPKTFFNGEKCVGNYKCEAAGANSSMNPCHNLTNGYYPMKQSPRKYFYCYHKAKVIELSCSEGKYYNRNEKGCMELATSSSSSLSAQQQQAEQEQLQSNLVTDEKQSCINKPNGFYTILSSNCSKYYYCIQGEKTQLECQSTFVFNGQLCVARSQFSCPNNQNNNDSNR